MKYGIKAYGRTTFFKNERAYRLYLMEWISGSDGAERERAVRALANLENGIGVTDTDKEVA